MKDNKPTFIKLGNLVFNADGAKEMSYKQFMDTYTDVLKGYDVKKAEQAFARFHFQSLINRLLGKKSEPKLEQQKLI